MKRRFTRGNAIAAAAIAAAIGVTSGCSTLTGDDDEEQARIAPCGVEYRCEAAGGEPAHSIYLHKAERKPGALWVVLPEREFRVDPEGTGTPASRYTNGRSTLDLAGDVATLTEEGKVTYGNCKRVGTGALPSCGVEREPAIYIGVPSP